MKTRENKVLYKKTDKFEFNMKPLGTLSSDSLISVYLLNLFHFFFVTRFRD